MLLQYFSIVLKCLLRWSRMEQSSNSCHLRGQDGSQAAYSARGAQCALLSQGHSIVSGRPGSPPPDQAELFALVCCAADKGGKQPSSLTSPYCSWTATHTLPAQQS